MRLLGRKRKDLVNQAERLFADAVAMTAPGLSDLRLPPPRTEIKEADLQRALKANLEVLAAEARPRASVSPTLGHALKKEWPRLGNFDISLSWPQATVFGELKCGTEESTLSACGWDAAKCAFALRQGVGDGMVLIAAAPAELWDVGVPGTELLLGGRGWEMQDIRSRYRKGFTKWERDGYKPIWVPASFDTRRVADPVRFNMAGAPWELHVAAVEHVSDERLEWVPLLEAST